MTQRTQTAFLPPDAQQRYENELRGRLGLFPVGEKILSDAQRRLSWILTGVVALSAALVRFVGLSHPNNLVFDETYYVKGANSLLRIGYEAKWEGGVKNDIYFSMGDYSYQTTTADYVVHPPLGKWLMAVGQWLFGQTNGYGWRATVAVCGVLSVILLIRISLRLFLSPWIAAFTGFLMAIDGMGIVLSRTGLLDNILALFILLSFWAILKDRDSSRAVLAHSVAFGRVRCDGTVRKLGPNMHIRGWLLLAGLFLGASCAVKWSGIYALAVCGITVYAWGTFARRTIHINRWGVAGFWKEGVPAFFHLVPTALLAYNLSWLGWWRNPHSWGRGSLYGKTQGTVDDSVWQKIQELWNYHIQMWDFHNGLSTKHTYQSQAWDWLLQLRPVSFYWKGVEDTPKNCGSKECVQAITSIGNPLLWWLAFACLWVVLWYALRQRDWRAWFIVCGYAALWLPWVCYTNRTIFEFYAIVFLPFVCLALTFGLCVLTSNLGKPHVSGTEESVIFSIYPTHAENDVWVLPQPDSENITVYDDENTDVPTFSEIVNSPQDSPPWWTFTRCPFSLVIFVTVAVVLFIFSAFWYPLWTGMSVPFWFWQIHMWLATWV